MVRFVRHIDLQRLAGINRMLGVDMTEEHIRVVELQKSRALFNPNTIVNKFNSKFRATHSCSHNFASGESLEEKVKSVRSLLAQNGITARYAVSSIQSLGAISLIADVPVKVASIDEWIAEHYEKLLTVPVPLSQLSLTYEILSRHDSTLAVEISFVRKSEVEWQQRFFQELGLHLVSLSVGNRDAQNNLRYTDGVKMEEVTEFVYAEKENVTVTRFTSGRVAQREMLHAVLNGERLNKILSGVSEGKVFVAGQFSDQSDGIRTITPFGLASDYTLAAGLALKGFLPELSPTSVLNQETRAKAEEKFFRSLFQHTVLVMGAVLALVLFLPFVLTTYFQARIDSAQEALLKAGPSYNRLMALEQHVKNLRAEIGRNGSSHHRSATSRLLHEVARVTPDGIWLSRILLNTTQEETVTLWGFSKNSEAIADYLRQLESEHVGRNVQLVRSGTPLQNDPTTLTISTMHGATAFQIQMNVTKNK